MNEIIVRYMDMPTTVKGVAVKDADGDYNVYINPRLGDVAQVLAYEHELRHINRGDFESEKETVSEKEVANW